MGRDLASVYREMRRRRGSESDNRISHGATVRRIDNFYQESDLHHFKVYSDEHAEPWGGTDKGPSPLGYLLSAIGFSINNQILIQSEVNGVELDSLETVVTGWFDPKGSLDIKGHNPRLSRISLQFHVSSRSPVAEVKRIVRKAASCDVVYQTIAKAAKMETRVTMVDAKGGARGGAVHGTGEPG